MSTVDDECETARFGIVTTTDPLCMHRIYRSHRCHSVFRGKEEEGRVKKRGEEESRRGEKKTGQKKN